MLHRLAGLGRLILACALFACAAAATAGPKRLVIVDDDVIGLNGVLPLVLQTADVELLGVTTTSGSVWRDTATAHALRTLEIMGRRDVPVVPGATYPLLNSAERTKRWEGLHGRLVFKGPWTDYWPEGTLQPPPGQRSPDFVPPLPEGDPTTKPAAEIAALFLIRQVRAHPGEVTIIATGPMTNIALAQSLDPGFAANVQALVYMGGSLNPQQRLASKAAEEFAREYVNTPRREFNIRWDPEAARIVAHAPWRSVTMVPVDPSTGTEWTPAYLAEVAKAGTPLARAVATIAPGFPMWDEIAAMAWLRPGIVTRADRLWIDFDTGEGAGYGDTLSWSEAYRPGLGEQPQTVVREIDRQTMEAAMKALYVAPVRGR